MDPVRILVWIIFGALVVLVGFIILGVTAGGAREIMQTVQRWRRRKKRAEITSDKNRKEE